MRFSQIEFMILLLLLMVLFCFVKKNTARKGLLLAVSYYFYAYWDYRFLGLLLIPTLVDYTIGLTLGETGSVVKRRILLSLSIIINLSILGVFKYLNFFIVALQDLIGVEALGVNTINIILPLGISFYTFRVLSYTIDVYMRRLEPCRSLLDFALFVAFFPCLLAGPIVRAAHLLPQFKQVRIIKLEDFSLGIRLFIIGLTQKIFIADNLGMFVDYFFANSGVFNTATTWLAVLAYTGQIYCDFAGYSNMAIGVARLLGYDLNVNFYFPYLATNMGEFWKRWHITLSHWIKDYIYIALGGSKISVLRTYINLMVAMVLCGLWHGAAWTFLFWGGYHGVASVVNHLWRRNSSKEWQFQYATLSWFITFFTVMIGWVFFRAHDFSQAIQILHYMFFPHPGIHWINPFVIFALISMLIIHLAEAFNLGRIHQLPINAWYTPALLFCMLWLVVMFYPKEFSPFIYGQF